MAGLTLEALMTGVPAASFFQNVYEKSPLHVRSDGREEPSFLLTEEDVIAALASLESAPDGLMSFPAGASLPAPPELSAWIDDGHALVWNRAHKAFPAVDELAENLARTFGAHVWPNVYWTGPTIPTFEAHFDCHEVLVVHCAGKKTWRISEVRVDRPHDAAELEDVVAATMRARREEAKAKTALEVEVAPGDVLYIPRGQFHDARAVSGRSLHVTFGIRPFAGIDVVRALAAAAIAEPLFREYLPPVAADPSGERASEQIVRSVARLIEIATSEDFADDLARARQKLVR